MRLKVAMRVSIVQAPMEIRVMPKRARKPKKIDSGIVKSFRIMLS